MQGGTVLLAGTRPWLGRGGGVGSGTGGGISAGQVEEHRVHATGRAVKCAELVGGVAGR